MRKKTCWAVFLLMKKMLFHFNMKKLQHTGENQQTPKFTTEIRTKHKYKFTTDKVSDFMRIHYQFGPKSSEM